jgi:hypothetical protein
MKTPNLPLVVMTVASALVCAESAIAQTPPPLAPGKEYTDDPDIAVPGQITLWDGVGGVALGPVLPLGVSPFQIDALAHRNDAFFNEVSFFNTASLLISVKRDAAANSVWYENPDASRGVWATKAQVNAAGVSDLDALEVWGPEGVSDTDFLSSHGDLGGSAIVTKNGLTALTSAELAAAIGLVPGAGTVNGVALSDALIRNLIQQVQLDGLMYDRSSPAPFLDIIPGTGAVPVPVDAFVGDDILFSIEPISFATTNGVVTLFDGGEIWTYTIGSLVPAAFLDHGGHLWNTPFDVKGSFGVDSEDVDALEAVAMTPVPEAGTMAAAGVLAVLAGAHVWRRRQHS